MALLVFSACSRPPEGMGDADSTQVSKTTLADIGPLSVLDIDNIKIYAPGDTTVNFPENPAADSTTEINAFKKDARVIRVHEGIKFQLPSGEIKLLKENKSIDGDDFAGYTFLGAMDDIGQWLVLASYYESMDYILVDQMNGIETHLWGYPVVSPDRNHILSSMVDIEAGFVPNGFQLWSIEDGNFVLAYEQELTDWSFDKSIWTNDNKIVTEQTYRDEASGELKTRVIKMRFVEGVE